MSSVPTAADIARDATWLAQAMDPRTELVRLVRMDRQAYRSASFLDDRILQQPVEPALSQWSEVAGAIPPDARSDARWIFHIGHVGSTLIARLLGELDGVLAVREPRILRDLAMLPEKERTSFTEPLRRLLSRTFAPDEIALVKATSFVSEIAAELVPAGGRVLFLHASPRNYVASILAGENSVKELAALAPSRAQRMAGRAALPSPRTAADLAAAAWACETTSLEAAANAMSDRHLEWMDFDAMLDDVAAALGNVAQAFAFRAERSALESIASGPLMHAYSKALEYDYSPQLRRDLIAEADEANRHDIDSALAMLQSASLNSPLLKRALTRARD